MRIYITGASCAGVTTLGQHLATLRGIKHADVDDFFWMPTNPPFTTKRPAEERVPLIQQVLGDDDWVLTGSCMVWGEALLTEVDLIVFVSTPTPLRLERLAAREAQPPGLARQSIALNRDLVLIDQISETAHRTDGGAIADDRENIVAADRLRPRPRAVAAEQPLQRAQIDNY